MSDKEHILKLARGDIALIVNNEDGWFSKMAIAFADDADFCTNGANHEEKMRLIMDLRAKLCEETGGKIQQTKIIFLKNNKTE